MNEIENSVATEELGTEIAENNASTQEAGGNESESPNTESPEKNDSSKETKSFTQEMVDEIVRSRLERDRKSFYKRYGVENRDDLDGLIGKSQSYDIMKERYEQIKEENQGLKKKMAFITNNINPSREEDIEAYFKGKDIEFNGDNLMKELETHPEWLNVVQKEVTPQTTIKKIGVDKSDFKHVESEDERIKRIFGV